MNATSASDGELKKDPVSASATILYQSHLKEIGSRLELARKQGQEAAERKKLSEINVLKSELGQKSR